MASSKRVGRLRTFAPLAVAAATLALMVATGPRLALGFDEEISLRRMERVRSWLAAMADPPGFARGWDPSRVRMLPDDSPPPGPADVSTRRSLLRPAVVRWFWPFARQEPHGHPPFYVLVGLAGDALAPGWAELPRARLGTMLAFGLAGGAPYAAAAARAGPWAGATASAAWVFHPDLFGLGHYATYDALLSSLWLGAILAFARAVQGPRARWAWALLLGGLMGAAASTKFTGWLLPIPFFFYVALARDGRALRALLVAGLVGIATVYALNPAWWADPVGGVEAFLRSNLGRARTAPMPVSFLGRIYVTPGESLPWYNTLAWTLFATPVGFLSLALAGAWRSLRAGRGEVLGRLGVAHWAFLLILRALPHTPGHDGVRQFLPAFGCLALLAGLGAEGALRRLGRWARPALGLAIAEGAARVALMMLVPLSYYSPLIGGPAGAARLGMEPTYYWDALGDDAIAWLRVNTPPGQTVMFSTNTESWSYLVRTGKLEAVSPFAPGPRAWYVLQNRPGAFTRLDRALVAGGRGRVLAST